MKNPKGHRFLDLDTFYHLQFSDFYFDLGYFHVYLKWPRLKLNWQGLISKTSEDLVVPHGGKKLDQGIHC